MWEEKNINSLNEQIMLLLVEERDTDRLIELSLEAVNYDRYDLIANYGLAEGYRRNKDWINAYFYYFALFSIQDCGNSIIDQGVVEKLMNQCLDEIMIELHGLLVQYASSYLSSKQIPLIDEGISLIFNIFNEQQKTVFLDRLEMGHIDSPDAAALMYSALFFSTGFENSLNRIEALISKKRFNYDISRGLAIYIDNKRFSSGIDLPSYRYRRELLDSCYGLFFDLMSVEVTNIPPSDRISNRVVVTTGQMLSLGHAPTRMVYNLCKILQEKLHYEVLLVVCAETKGTMEACSGIWLERIRVNFNEGLWGVHKVYYEDDGPSFNLIQIPINSEQKELMKDVFSYIVDYKPMYVWNVGGTCCFAELLGRVTTLVSMPCSAGLSVSNAPFLIRYMRLNDGREEEQVAKSRGQTILDMNWTLETPDVQSLDRDELAIRGPESFLIGIMGNRLNTEINEQFMNIMYEVVAANPKVVYVIIGDCKLDFESNGLKQHILKLGFREDYLAVLKSMDLVVNPKRNGAGANVYAVIMGTPVVTLPNCDVASAIGNDAFICDKYADFPRVIDRYINDHDYMRCQIDECHKVAKMANKTNLTDEIKQIDSMIRENLCQELSFG
ncbi:Glycosyl transferases group 1 [Lachnospiraceae bacterium XBB2008]|nr:Glycosyl transferases group 1 [Lachnospiraceae bacterium XBB2008]